MNFTKYKDVPISFSVNKQYETKDTRYLDITIDVLHTGQNFNGSIFNKETVDTNIESIKNTPILGYVLLNEDGSADDFKAHQYKTIKKDGKYEYVYSGSSYGVIPESCNPRWINKVSSDGILREYLQVDALLWTKFDKAIDIFTRDLIKGQSMELEESSMNGVEDENGIFTFTEFKFDGCCILSTTDPRIQPAMIDSVAVANFSTDNIVSEIKEKLKEYYATVNFEDKTIQEESGKGNIILDKNEQFNTLLTKYNLKIEDIDFSIEDLTIEDLEVKLQQFTATKIEPEVPNEDATATDFSLTAGQFEDELRNQLRAEKYRDNWGDECPRYSYYDYKDLEVYVFDRLENYNLVGFSFTVDGDKVSVDFATKKRKKIEIVDFEDGVSSNIPNLMPMDNLDYQITKSVEVGVKEISDKFTDLESEFSTYKETFKTAETDVELLREFQSKTLSDKLEEDQKKVFEMTEFEKLSGNEEFEALKAKASEFETIDALVDKCFSILGRVATKFSLDSTIDKKTVKVSIDTTDSSNDQIYGGLFDKYATNK